MAVEANNTAETGNSEAADSEPDPDPDGALAEALLTSAFASYSHCMHEGCEGQASHLLFCYRCSASYPTCSQHVPNKVDSDVVIFPCDHICLTETVQSWPL